MASLRLLTKIKLCLIFCSFSLHGAVPEALEPYIPDQSTPLRIRQDFNNLATATQHDFEAVDRTRQIECAAAALIAPISLLAHGTAKIHASQLTKLLLILEDSARLVQNGCRIARKDYSLDAEKGPFAPALLLHDAWSLLATLQADSNHCTALRNKRHSLFLLFPLIESSCGIIAALHTTHSQPNLDLIKLLGTLARLTDSIMQTNLDDNSHGKENFVKACATLSAILYLTHWLKNHRPFSLTDNDLLT